MLYINSPLLFLNIKKIYRVFVKIDCNDFIVEILFTDN